MGLPSHADLADAELVGRLCGVEGRRGRRLGGPAPDGKDRDEGVGRVVALHGDLHDGTFARELLDEYVQDPLAFHRDEGRGLAEGHPDLEAGLLAGLVALLFGDDVDAVVVAGLEPPFVLAGHPEVEVGQGGIAVLVFRFGLEDDAARDGRGASQSRVPEASVFPLQCGPASQVAIPASSDLAWQGTAMRLISVRFS